MSGNQWQWPRLLGFLGFVTLVAVLSPNRDSADSGRNRLSTTPGTGRSPGLSGSTTGASTAEVTDATPTALSSSTRTRANTSTQCPANSLSSQSSASATASSSAAATVTVSTPRADLRHQVAPAQAVLDCWAMGSWQHANITATLTGRDPWSWVTSSCAVELPQLTHRWWCGAHAGASILFLGDSITQNHFEATLEFLRLEGDHQTELAIECDSQRAKNPFIAGCRATSVCNGDTTLAYIRTDHLLLNTSARQWSGYQVNVMTHPVAAGIRMLKPTHILANRGAHYAPDGVYVAGIQDAVLGLRSLAPTALVLWRNTPAGHPNCALAKGPSDEAVNVSQMPYHWGDFPRQNDLMKRAVNGAGLPCIDLAAPTIRRPDHHLASNDCLHYHHLTMAVTVTWVRLAAAAVWLLDGNAVVRPGASPRIPGHAVLFQAVADRTASSSMFGIGNFTRRMHCYAKRQGYESHVLLGLNGTSALRAAWEQPPISPYNLRVPLLAHMLDDPLSRADFVVYLDTDAAMHHAPSIAAWVASVERGLNVSACDVIAQDQGHIINTGVLIFRRGSPVAREFVRAWWGSIRRISGLGLINKPSAFWVHDQGPAMNAALHMFSRSLPPGARAYADECAAVAAANVSVPAHAANLCYRDWMNNWGFHPQRRAVGGLCFPGLASPYPLRFQSHFGAPPNASDPILHGKDADVLRLMRAEPDLEVC